MIRDSEKVFDGFKKKLSFINFVKKILKIGCLKKSSN